jgi:dihydrofolate reductase
MDRKLVVSAYVSLDGVAEDPVGMENSGLGHWVEGFTRGPSGDRLMIDELFRSDVVLLGRRTYEGFAAVWPTVTDETGFAERLNSMRKYVASTTLERAGWANTTVMPDALAGVPELKAEGGGDVLVYGSAGLVHPLMRAGLVDEVHLLVYPTILGRGGRLLPPDYSSRLALVESLELGDGILHLRYRPAS